MISRGILHFVLLICMGTIPTAIGFNFTDLNLKHSENDLRLWLPPDEFRTNFTYYLAGYDDDGSPMGITEWGLWNVRKLIDQGGRVVEDLEKFVDKIIFEVYDSMRLRELPDGSLPLFKAIIDLEGYSYSQLRSFKTLQFYFKIFTSIAPILQKYMAKAYALNANFIAESGINMLRPILGGVMEKIEIYGPNKANWIKQVRKSVPEEILPEWYGGSKDFKPLKICG